MANNESWAKIFSDYNILEHNFNESPFELSAQNIKTSCQNFTEVNQKEVRVLCKQDTRADRPQIFIDNELFLLPIKNGNYIIVKFCFSKKKIKLRNPHLLAFPDKLLW